MSYAPSSLITKAYILPILFFHRQQQQQEEAPTDVVDDNQNSLTELDVAEKDCCKINF